MTIYAGVPAIGTFIVTVPICFTGTEAKIARGTIVSLEALLVGVAGMLLGALTGILAGPEAPPIGAVVGLVIGLILGGVVGAIACSKGGCACPPPAEGFCMRLLYLRVPGTSQVVPLPPFVQPDPGSCPVLVPPGCP